MKGSFIISFFITYVLGSFMPSFAQPTPRQRRERMKIVKRVSKIRNPFIRLNDNKEISVEEFINLSDSIWGIFPYQNDSELAHQWGEKGKNGMINVTTVQYQDSLAIAYRKEEIKLYRENEMECFFGKDEPLILFGDREISRQEYCELPEDTVAFVNFYMTKFVREHYAPNGANGIVYVCPRNTRSKIKYTRNIDYPANGRNYQRSLMYPTPSFRDGGWYSYIPYIHEKVKEYRTSIDKAIKATVIISCVIRPNGSIDPILVERIDTQQELTTEQQDTLVEISEQIIRSMPKWDNPGLELLYDKRTKEYIADEREYAVSIPVAF